MKKDLESNLHDVFSNVPPISNSKGMEDTIIKVRNIMNESKCNDLTFWQFFFEQFAFIRKKVWIIQFGVLLICGLKLYYSIYEIQTIAWISAIAPIILLSGITELSRTYTYGTAEIELSTQYTLREVMIARITILGLIDILCLTILCFLVSINISIQPYIVFIYICVPFMVTCFGCLWILNVVKNKECNYYCFILGICVMTATIFSNLYFSNMYLASAFLIWIILFAISITGVSLQIYRLIKDCNRKLDYINLYNI